MIVIEITKDRHMDLAGLDWDKAMQLAQSDGFPAKVVQIRERSADKDWPGRVVDPELPATLLPHLGVGNVWLRKVDGRAFLYLTNYD